MISKEKKDPSENYNLKGRAIPLVTTGNLGRTSPHLSDIDPADKKIFESAFKTTHTGPSGRGPINPVEQMIQLKSTYGRKQVIVDPANLKNDRKSAERVRLPTEANSVKAIAR
mmetsp:Transcript_41957/g.64240  ORF Transcript_41957/g.64240 Transcript_41957/m.64240 type:complete len:113 (+) Transcript_41957:304-642(+)